MKPACSRRCRQAQLAPARARRHTGRPAGSTLWALWATVSCAAVGGVSRAGDVTAAQGPTADDTRSPSEPTVVLDTLPVSASQRIAQQTPLAVSDDGLYLAVLQPSIAGEDEGISLQTVLLDAPLPDAGKPVPRRPLPWRRTVIDGDSAFDEWHTAPAVGVDAVGRIHVAYNMHNLPWQYVESAEPGAVDRFEFRGQAITPDELATMKFENRTRFPSPGKAAIPGNQITYPAFYNDRDGSLWVTYRFAARPALPFERRAMSAGIARHDDATDTWSAVGAPLPRVPGDFLPARADPVPALAGEEGWTAYHPRLAFGPTGRLHVGFEWRRGIAGEELERPCHLVSDDLRSFRSAEGAAVTLPARPDACGSIVPPEEVDGPYYSVGSIAVDDDDVPYVVLSPTDRQREIRSFTGGEWHAEPSPYAAPEIFFDRAGTLWAIATGPVIHAKPRGGEWTKVYESAERKYCELRATLDRGGERAWLYAPHCDADAVSVLALDLGAAAVP